MRFTPLILVLASIVEASPIHHNKTHQHGPGAIDLIEFIEYDLDEKYPPSGPNYHPFEGLDMPEMIEVIAPDGSIILEFPEGTNFTFEQAGHLMGGHFDKDDVIRVIDDEGNKWTNRNISEHRKRGGAGQQCWTVPCNAGCQSPGYQWIQKNYNAVFGDLHQISDVICGPGQIGTSYTSSSSWSVNAQFGPDLKIGGDVLDKFAIRVSFSYTWGKAESTTYTVQCQGYTSCNAWFRHEIGIIVGTAYAVTTAIGPDDQTLLTCTKSAPEGLSVHVPITTGYCTTNLCGAAGSHGICYNPLYFGCPAAGGPFPSQYVMCPAGFNIGLNG